MRMPTERPNERPNEPPTDLSRPLPFDHDAALLACARGERFALRALYDQEARWLLGVALRIVRDRARAEDVLQDAFLQIWTRAASFDPTLGSGRGWIYTLVRHRALNAVRSAGREVGMDDVALDDLRTAADLQDAAAAAAASDRADAVHRCLDTLASPRRAMLLQAFVEGRTHDEIARRTATPIGTVKTWIRRSLLSLKECLS